MGRGSWALQGPGSLGPPRRWFRSGLASGLAALGLVSGRGGCFRLLPGLLQVAAGLVVVHVYCRRLALRLRLGCCGAGQVVDGPRGRSGGKPQVPVPGLACFTDADSSLLASACGHEAKQEKGAVYSPPCTG